MGSGGGPLQAPVAKAAEAASSCSRRRRCGEKSSGLPVGCPFMSSSAVACGAVCHSSRIENVVIGEQRARLAWGGGLSGRHVEDLLGLHEVRAWIAMTRQTPTHFQALNARGQWHLIDAPVACFAGHPMSDVCAVIEK